MPVKKPVASIIGTPAHQILIFCTSLETSDDVQKISPVLNGLKAIKSWTVDLEDCDRVLRIVGTSNGLNDILSGLQDLKFIIREMPD